MLEGQFCIYLRKSRSDLEAEGKGEEDTYTRHMNNLLQLQKKLGINVTEIYKEKPITGERISARPEMLRLLNDIEDNRWDGVLVVEVERLARGDTLDQGIVSQAFKYSDTLIITPMRTYDPNDPNDEEYFEFGLFMSRREFKTITRRLQGGRIDGVKEGRYMGNIAPYGYQRIKLPGKGYTLEPHPEQAQIVQLIFSLYTDPDIDKRLGTQLIAHYLNDKGIPTMRGSMWIVVTINTILRNPTYIGNVRWKSRPLLKRRDSISRPRLQRKDWIEQKGLHPAIIDENTFNMAQQIMKANNNNPGPKKGVTVNPLAGLIRCGVCGSAVIMRQFGDKTPATLMCSMPRCKNVSAYFQLIEDRLLQGLREWLESYKVDWESKRPTINTFDDMKLKANQDAYKSLENKLKELSKQKSSLHDLLELKIYTIEVYLERSKNLDLRIEETKNSLEQTKQALEVYNKRESARTNIIPQIEHVLDVYNEAQTPEEKNQLLKLILGSVVYTKKEGGRWSGAQDKFTLELQPKLPELKI
ncbi:recombinase family protein [Paenibacillus sp. FSL A5-0031]|nr:recombinase family protein [Paenibacillus sp. FSL A5-0031]